MAGSVVMQRFPNVGDGRPGVRIQVRSVLDAPNALITRDFLNEWTPRAWVHLDLSALERCDDAGLAILFQTLMETRGRRTSVRGMDAMRLERLPVWPE